MASISERTFGSRLLKAQDMATYIAGFVGYAPPRPQESVVNFDLLIGEVITANTDETAKETAYTTAVSNRHNAFRTNPNCVYKLLALINGAVSSQYGRKHSKTVQISALIRKLRTGKLIKVPASATAPAYLLSQSEQSYGSITQAFNDIITTLTVFGDFAPSNVNLQIATLQTFSASLTTLNIVVPETRSKLKTARDKRLALYTELSDRATRIKEYVKSNYGTQSPEYALVKGLKI